MEEDYRPFEAVKIGLTSVESGQERFTREGICMPPPVSYWRCNLTALSQRFNLYFVATKDTIAVYKPDFPFQKLHKLPVLVIPPSLANPTARGYIEDRVPHAVNHLVVGDLGKEEILLLATDSGNVTAYYTKAIEEAIRKDPYRFSTDARSDHVGVRPFFTHSVHESAWGLAIHTNARMIAVSANTPYHVANEDPCAKVTVFAFALTEYSAGSGDEDSEDGREAAFYEQAREPEWTEWRTWVDAGPPARNRNYKITLAGVEGHDHNIPCISFVNTPDDMDGKWLLSTDINGGMKIWQIWQGICQNSWDFEGRMRSGFFRRREGGWLVAALDPRSFQLAKTMDQFCGHSKAPQYHGHNNLESYDLTHIVRLRTPGNSHAHPAMYESTEDDVEMDDTTDSPDTWSNVDDAAVEPDQSQNDPSLFSDHFNYSRGAQEGQPAGNTDDWEHEGESISAENVPEHLHIDVGTTGAGDTSAEAALDTVSLEDIRFDDAEDDFVQDEDEENEYLSASEGQADYDDRSSVSRRSTTSLSSLAHPTSPEIDVDIQSASDMESPSRRRQLDEAKSPDRVFAINDSSVVRARGAANAPEIPTLHCSASNLRLLMAPRAESPHIFCANLLKQALPPAFEASNHAHIDRLNMMLQIPELGIVIVATQIGRCAVCALTKNERTGTLGLRVDWILPSKAQELKGDRPVGPLLGIAASPVQGRFRSRSPSNGQSSAGVGCWGVDGIVDGISTTFDPTVVVVDESGIERTGTNHQKSNRNTMKRRRDPQDSNTRTEVRTWNLPQGTESWQAMESSRRYRLMLTYLDMTVLTYELSRGIEKDDVAHEEVISSLELLD
ncbi:hypothetical protein H2200_012150 [Cladophialophora chaetospira]|uniref:Uncharacterized protein n=1 Tax=Cladophialophora chaetospira TaxID=386627 RepID=A0AA38WYD2_9EURO|nr:hypothetical protein H2200_012150 [Cladophialophora chaetospira]